MVTTISDLTDKLDTYLDTEQVEMVRRAYYCAEQAHLGKPVDQVNLMSPIPLL